MNDVLKDALKFLGFFKRRSKSGISTTRIMINKGMANKGKYWIFEKNKGAPVSYFKDLKGTYRDVQYSISSNLSYLGFFVDKIQ